MTFDCARRDPLDHQLELFELTKDREAFAVFWEQRCGKTLPTIATLAHQYRLGTVNAAIVVAPNGVHADWVTEFLPLDLPEWVPWLGHAWRSHRARGAAASREMEQLLCYGGLAVFSVNIEAIGLEHCRKYIGRLLKARRCMVIIDESDLISTPSIRASRIVHAMRPYAPVRRILTGTPAAEGPLGLWSQFQFLHPETFIDVANFDVFKAIYASPYQVVKPTASGKTARYTVYRYRNLEELQQRIAPISSRLLRRDCLALPEKTYEKRRFQLTETQRKVYDELRLRLIAELETGETITVKNRLSCYLRLQQVASNWVNVENEPLVRCPACAGTRDDCSACDGLGVVPNPEPRSTRIVDPLRNPRSDALREELLRSSESTIVWSRFRTDVDETLRVAEAVGRRAVRYDGLSSTAEREAALLAFRNGRASVFAASPAAAGRGRDLSVAGKIVYYSNYFGLRVRLQSEDRAERVGRTESTTIVDLIAEGTVDERIVQALRMKRSVQDVIVGDDPREWL